MEIFHLTFVYIATNTHNVLDSRSREDHGHILSIFLSEWLNDLTVSHCLYESSCATLELQSQGTTKALESEFVRFDYIIVVGGMTI